MEGRIRSLLHRCILLICLMSAVLFGELDSSAIQLNEGNIDDILKNNDIVFINFYADWCRFSQMLKPVFEEAADKVNEQFPDSGKVVMGRVDCDREGAIAQRFHISKYPTLKLFRGGEVVKREYRGQRSSQAISAYVGEQLKEIVTIHEDMESIDSLEGGVNHENKRNIIGYFESKESDGYRNFASVASRLRDDCGFHAAFGDVSAKERQAGDSVLYRPPKTKHEDVLYMGQATQFDALNMWMTDKCVPLVREITFENAEELTEEGLPFLILFHHPDDTETPKQFQLEVARQVITEKSSINFLTADGVKFSHPLHHLGKSQNDLPVLAIDSFRHMYVFPHDVKTGIQTQGLLKQFIQDLHSGKLHKEFHEPPKPTTRAPPPPQIDEEGEEHGREKRDVHIPIEPDNNEVVEQTDETAPKDPTSPPESTFKKLAPSRNRYTLLRDEL